MAEVPETRGVPRTAVGIMMLALLTLGVLAYMAPSVLTPLFLGLLLFLVLIIYTVTDFLVKKHIIPSDYLYLTPILILGAAFIMAGLAQRGYLPMAVITGNEWFDMINTTLLYALVIAAAVGVGAFVVYWFYYRPRAAGAE